MVGAAIFMLVLIEAIIIVESIILLQKMKEMTLTISSEGIERTGGRYTETISFSDILKLPSPNTLQVRLPRLS